MYISEDHGEDPHTDFYDMNFNRIPMQFMDKNSNKDIPKPEKFEELKQLASKLSQSIPFVRADFYVSGNNIFFGEMTFYHNGGYFPVSPSEKNLEIGQMICVCKN